jgi:hypothetical protein
MEMCNRINVKFQIITYMVSSLSFLLFFQAIVDQFCA